MAELCGFVDPNVERVWSLITTTSQNILLHGPGGCGHSYLIKRINERCRDAGIKIAVTATTGIAALQINGMTIHSWSGIGVMVNDRKKMLGRIFNKPVCIDRIRNVQLLVIDEISMFGIKTIEMINYLFRKIRRSKSPFGGVRVLLSGDFLQLPPVKDDWAFKSKVWPQLRLNVVELTEPKRYTDVEYFHLLLRVREGKPTPDDIEFLYSRVKAYDEKVNEEERMTEEERNTLIKPTILFSRKLDVSSFNNRQMAKLKGKEYTYTSYDTLEPLKGSRCTIKTYESRLDDGIPKIVTLKVGAQVMLKRNIDIPRGLVNGSRGVVIDLNTEQVTVRFINGDIETISRRVWTVEDERAMAHRSQMPFILAWALTVHSTQGCTIDYAVCDCGGSIFACGQAYVSISRVRCSKGLFLLEFIPEAIKTDLEALNYVNSLNDDVIEEEPEEYTEEDIKHTKEELNIDLLRVLNISSKNKLNDWLRRNHPDKGGDTELCQRVISAGKKRFG